MIEHISQNYHIFILLYFKSQPLYCEKSHECRTWKFWSQ